MAIRQTAAEKKAAEEAAKAPAVTNDLPDAWAGMGVEEFYGHNLTDKADLENVPFLVIGVEIERNEGKTYDVAYLYALDQHGTEFEFSDTSDTGVRGQIQAILAERELDPAPGGGFIKLQPGIFCRRGLRFNEYPFVDQETGKKRTARTYYFAAAGRKPEEASKNEG